MQRYRIIALGIGIGAVAACTHELTCWPGAIVNDGVCECPPGTVFVRPSECAVVDGGTDAGASLNIGLDAASDSAAFFIGASDAASDGARASGPSELDASYPDAAASMMDAMVSIGPMCTAAQLTCGSVCVDPLTDTAHCGSCNPCAAGNLCNKGQCVEAGCSDGTREAFIDPTNFPTIAGCAAIWPAASMTDARKLAVCGNSSVACQVPADACASGWHVCGNVAQAGTDVTSRIQQADCDAQNGAFAAALGDHDCTPCTADGNGAACCGSDCVQQNGSCLWTNATAWFGVRNGIVEHCGLIDNPDATGTIGVMCCHD